MTKIKKVLFVAFSHSLTSEQISDAQKTLGIDEIVSLGESNPELQKMVSNVDPEATPQHIMVLAQNLINEASKANATHFYMAGEPALFLYSTLFANKYGLKVVQSTTKRESVETTKPDGTVIKTAIFKHVQWRELKI